MIKPVYYMQTDSKWSKHDYSASGESKSIGSSGCGPTSAAMIIQTLRPDLTVTPVTTADWSKKHGYKIKNQGTAYSYFINQFKKYGISCRMLNSTNLYNKPDSKIHSEAKSLLKHGHFLIAVMGPGNWTKAGHYIVAYGLQGDKVLINDPASTSSSRSKNTWKLFTKQVKYYWSISYGKKVEIKKGSLFKTNDILKKIKTFSNNINFYHIKDLKNGWSIGCTESMVGYVKNKILDNKLSLSTYPKYKTTKKAAFRKSNSLKSKSMMSLPIGTKVKLITKRKHWSFCDLNGKTGWIATKKLKEIK